MFLFYLFAAYVLLLIVMRILEHRMIFFPNYPSRLDGDWHPRKLNPEEVWLTHPMGPSSMPGGCPVLQQDSLFSHFTATPPT